MQPFTHTQRAVELQSVNFSKSPLFSEADFESLLEAHESHLLEPDLHLCPRPAIYPLFTINPSTVTTQCSLDHNFGFVFLPTFTNTVYSLLTRVLMPLSVPVPNKLDFCLDFFESLPPCPLSETYVQEYLDSLKPHNRKRLLLAHENLKIQYVLPRKVDVFPKSDELLIDKTKPRVIWNVPPTFQVILGPHVKRMTNHYASLFDGKRIHLYRGKRFTLLFACGLVAEDLDQWFNTSIALLRSNTVDFCGVYLGDDSLVLVLRDGVIIAVEGDFSKFDRSQEKACFEYGQKIYAHNKVSPVDLEARRAMFHCALRVKYGKHKEFKFSVRLKQPQQATGQPGTCLDNTVLNMASSIHVMFGGSFKDFGFDAKVREGPFEHCTFLRGFWCLGLDQQYHWNYLPSVAIKLCKSLVPFRKLFPLHPFPIYPTANAMFSSVGLCQSPLLRIGVRRFASGTKSITKDLKVIRLSNRIPLDDSSLWSFIRNRYGLDGAFQIQSLEEMFCQTPLGGSLHHPGWAVLAQDYA